MLVQRCCPRRVGFNPPTLQRLKNADVIVDTRTNGKFRPNEAITRAELAAMLAQFADIKSAANSFNDVSARHWASDEIAVCAKMGWINGYPDGSFRPDATITRAEMMAMINRALGRHAEVGRRSAVRHEDLARQRKRQRMVLSRRAGGYQQPHLHEIWYP